MTTCRLICLLVLFACPLTAADDPEKFEFKADGNYVSYEGTTVTLTCPGEDPEERPGEPPSGPVIWGRKEKVVVNETSSKFVIQNYTDKDNVLYYCSRDAKSRHKMYFYTKLKVCKGCVEVDMTQTAMFIVGDVLITFGVILIAYLIAKKKAGPAPPQRATHGRQASAPPPPDPDYQSLNPATRSKDLYAEARRKY